MSVWDELLAKFDGNQRRAAEALGVDSSLISRWRRAGTKEGRIPRRDSAEELARKLTTLLGRDVHPREVVWAEPSPATPAREAPEDEVAGGDEDSEAPAHAEPGDAPDSHKLAAAGV